MKNMMNDFYNTIYQYDNYRMFLNDFFEVCKERRRALSKRNFASKAGFSSHSYIVEIIKGKKNVSIKSLEKIIKGLDIYGAKAEYFKYLVLFNQAKKADQKETYYRELMKLRNRTGLFKLDKGYRAFFKKWYYQVVREVLVLKDWRGDYEALAESIFPPIKAREVEESIDILLDCALIKKNEDGSYSQLDSVLTAGEVPGQYFKNIKKEYIIKSIDAFEKLPMEKRHISYATVTMSEERYNEVVQLLDKVRDEITLGADEDCSNEKKVFQLNFQLYPLSKLIEKGEK